MIAKDNVRSRIELLTEIIGDAEKVAFTIPGGWFRLQLLRKFDEAKELLPKVREEAFVIYGVEDDSDRSTIIAGGESNSVQK